MISRALIFGFSVYFALAAWPCLAEVDLPGVDACIEKKEQTKQPPTACLDDAHAECISMPPELNAAATLCFTNARKTWSEGISKHMDSLRNQTSEDVAAFAGIEVKYDLLGGLVQCDRLEELSLLKAGGPNEDILRQKTRCAATASGLAYIRLFWRSRNLK